MAVTLLHKTLTAFFQTISINSKLYFTSYSTQQSLNMQVNTNERNRRYKKRVNLLGKFWNRIQTVNNVAVLSVATTDVTMADVVCTLVCPVSFVHRPNHCRWVIRFYMNSSSISTILVSYHMHESTVVVLKWSEWRTTHLIKTLLNHNFLSKAFSSPKAKVVDTASGCTEAKAYG